MDAASGYRPRVMACASIHGTGPGAAVPRPQPSRGFTIIASSLPMRTASRLPLAARAAALLLASVLLGLAGGCAEHPRVPLSEGHISKPPAAAAARAEDIPPALAAAPYVPPPRARPKVPTYSVVVYEVPVKELLLSLARDTRENIDVHPGLTGLVSLNAIDETLPAILERIARQVNMRYRIEGHTIVVGPDLPYVKVYAVNYVNMVRDTTSSIAVSGQISSTSNGGGASTTTVNTTSRNAFWDTLRENIQNILNTTRAQTQSADERARRDEAARAAREERLAQAEAVSKAGANASGLYSTVFGNNTPGGAANQDVVVNPGSGTIMVLASDRQHTLVQQYLDGVTAASQRQVLIEATIAEVKLNRSYQGGVDWNLLSSRSAFQLSQQTLNGALGAAPNFVLGTGTSRVGDVAGTIKLLETFGSTRVLSSPKLMALNNQTALLKVVDNIVYFQVQASISQGTNQAANLSTITTTPNTVAVGVVLSMTPQINENGMVTITVRPTVTRILDYVADPNPQLGAISNKVPEVQVREMESVLQLASGQTAILGGLMQDDIERSGNQVPGLGSIPRVGEAFKYRNESAVKTELIIFIRPVVVTNPTLDSAELRHLRKFLPAPDHNGDNP